MDLDMFTSSPPAATAPLPDDGSDLPRNAVASSSTLPSPSAPIPPAKPIKTKYLWPIPDIPGEPLHPNSPAVTFLTEHVSSLTTPINPNGYVGPGGYGNQLDTRFPGSQPVSFQRSSMDRLERRNFWVCEKSDGVRVMMLIVWNMAENVQEVYFIDRKNTYHELPPSQLVPFLHHDPSSRHRANLPLAVRTTLIDGELVYDAVPTKRSGSYPNVSGDSGGRTGTLSVDEGLFKHSANLDERTEEEIWRGKERRLRLYAFDCLVYDTENLMGRPLQSRYGRLTSWVVGPLHAQLARAPPEVRASQPFESVKIVTKKMELADGLTAVIDQHIPKLQHAYDGLIFTCAETEYVKGKTDEHIMKWKPPEDNTVDFELELRFLASPEGSDKVDLTSKPVFVLHAWAGGTDREYFDTMALSDETWEEWKASGEQFDDRVVECTWSEERSTFEFMRFRPDKTYGNHISVVRKVINSIQDGVSLSDLQTRCPSIRAKRKEREAALKAAARAPAPLTLQHQGYHLPPQGFGFQPQGHSMQTVPRLRR